MMDIEKLIEEIANRVRSGRDVSKWENIPFYSSLTKLLIKLGSFPKSQIPQIDLNSIKNKVMDRISIPEEMTENVGVRAGFLLPNAFKFLVGTAGTMLILISLSVGTAVAALQSNPGEAIYPLKKVVENIELKLTRDPNARANLQIQFANNRLEELSEIVARNKAGEISSDEAQKIVTETLNDLRETTQAALSSTSKTTKAQPKVTTLNKLVDLSNKQAAVLEPLISAANVNNEGEVKIILEEALESSNVTKEEAIKNIENAGLVVEEQPISIPQTNKVTANGEITFISRNVISIGTSRFLLTDDTKYINTTQDELKLKSAVEVSGEVKEDKQTYAVTITAITPTPVVEEETEDPTNEESENNENTQTDTQSNTDNESSSQ
jgi:hypothetical protein